MTFSFRSTEPAISGEAGAGGAAALPLTGMRLDKSAVIPPVVVRGLVRVAEFAGLSLLGLAIAHFYVNESGVLGLSLIHI